MLGNTKRITGFESRIYRFNFTDKHFGTESRLVEAVKAEFRTGSRPGLDHG